MFTFAQRGNLTNVHENRIHEGGGKKKATSNHAIVHHYVPTDYKIKILYRKE